MKKHPLWKKRLTYYVKNGLFWFEWLVCAFFSGIALLLFPVGFVATSFDWSMMGTIIGTFGTTFVGLGTYMLHHILFGEETDEDQDIRKEEKKKQCLAKADEEKQKEARLQNRKKRLLRLQEAIQALRHVDELLAAKAQNLFDAIQVIQNEYALPQEEAYYIHDVLPVDVAKSLSLYTQMSQAHRMDMQETLSDLLEKKHRELQTHLIDRLDDERKQAFRQQVALTERRTFE